MEVSRNRYRQREKTKQDLLLRENKNPQGEMLIMPLLIQMQARVLTEIYRIYIKLKMFNIK